MAPRTVGELGEFPLIDRLAARLRRPREDVVLGIGDDVAAVEARADRLLLTTCDVQVAGIHFLPDRCDPHRLGRKAAAINISDIAAAGGRPTHFVCSLVLPADTEIGFVESIYDGLAQEAVRWGADVVGGNVSRGDTLVLDLTLLGEVAREELLRRDGARVGDRVFVTGSLGAAAAGLQLKLNPGLRVDEALQSSALEAFEIPTPRVEEARALARAGGVSAMIDVSDGLAADLGHIAEASGVGVRIDAARIPVSEVAREVAREIAGDPMAWALAGGEDYELLFTAPPERVTPLIEALRGVAGSTVSEIGEIVDTSAGRSLVAPDGETTPLAGDGWRHF
jgi:thiamine-monophosphate kinase